MIGIIKAYGGGAVYVSSALDCCQHILLTINRHTKNSLKIYETTRDACSWASTCATRFSIPSFIQILQLNSTLLNH